MLEECLPSSEVIGLKGWLVQTRGWGWRGGGEGGWVGGRGGGGGRGRTGWLLLLAMATASLAGLVSCS